MITLSYHPYPALIGLFFASEIKIKEYFFLNRKITKSRVSKAETFLNTLVQKELRYLRKTIILTAQVLLS